MSLVRKTFTSHTAFSRERNVFLKLKGTGLGPELLTDFGGYLEYRFAEGTSFLDRFRALAGSPAALAADCEAFCRWYNSYREKTNLALGDADPEKFLFTEAGLIYTDFEKCRPGYAEQDLASIMGHFARLARAPEETGAEGAVPLSYEDVFSAMKLFICVCAGKIRWRPELLDKYLREELSWLAPKTIELLVTYMTCSGVVISTGSGDAAASATSMVAAMPQRVLCVSEESSLAFPGFEKLPCRSEASAIYAAARQCSQPWMLFLSGDVTGLNPNALQKLLSFEKKGVDAVFFNEAGGSASPLLIRVKAVLAYISPDLEDSQICSVLKQKASVRLLVSDNLYLEE